MKKILTLILLLFTLSVTSQIQVIQFNANWNTANGVKWLDQLTDCKVKEICIVADKAAQSKYKIVVVPTIVIYKDGEEVARFQANIMMQMEATKSDIQDKIDEIIMEDF